MWVWLKWFLYNRLVFVIYVYEKVVRFIVGVIICDIVFLFFILFKVFVLEKLLLSFRCRDQKEVREGVGRDAWGFDFFYLGIFENYLLFIESYNLGFFKLRLFFYN